MTTHIKACQEDCTGFVSNGCFSAFPCGCICHVKKVEEPSNGIAYVYGASETALSIMSFEGNWTAANCSKLLVDMPRTWKFVLDWAEKRGYTISERSPVSK